jgi:predicted N-formylglutamate amidohydrolase
MTLAASRPAPGPAAIPDFVELVNPDGAFPCLITCDHAGNGLPGMPQGLGLAPEALERHIAYDLFVAELARDLSCRLGAPAVLMGVSRLVIDCNRWIEDPRSILPESDGVTIPANAGVTASERGRRIESYFLPYHRIVQEALDDLRRRAGMPLFLALHSCTPSLGGLARPWSAGTFWHEDPRLSAALLAGLAARTDEALGDNEPFNGLEGAFSIDYHTWGAGIPACGLEVRDDRLMAPEGRDHWAGMLTQTLRDIVRDLLPRWRQEGGPGASSAIHAVKSRSP